MTEETIEKAAHWFAKNGNRCDIQHSFEPLENAAVVESYVAKCDFELEGYPIKKGTWLMTVEVDNDIFEKVRKGELTGFSMGGAGKYSTVDVDVPEEDAKGLIAKLAKMFNIGKGALKDEYDRRIKYDNFHTAFCVLRDSVESYDGSGNYNYETDEKKLRKALSEFNDIVVQLLSEPSIAKALNESRPSELVAEAEEKEEEEFMKAEDITSAVQKAMQPLEERLEAIENHVMRRAKTGEIDKIGIAGRQLRKKTEGIDDGYRANVTSNKIEYETTAVRLPWEITEETLRENIEGQNLEKIITDLMTSQMGIDSLDLYLNGDTAVESTDPDHDFLYINDGWIKQLKNGHVIDGSAASSSNTQLDMFYAAVKAVPNKYNNGKLRWIMSPHRKQIWEKYLIGQCLANGATVPDKLYDSPVSIPAIECSQLDDL